MSKGITPANRVRFQVAEVTPSTERLPCVDLLSALDRAAKTKLLICPEATREVLRDADFHPLIAAAAFAFQKHYPLALSPDMLWLTVLQGVAQHIQNHAEALRSRLVQHQTKIELVVKTDLSALPSDGPEMLAVVKAFSEQISRHIPADKRSLFQAEFSTTTDVERIAANVVLMDAFQPYFDYVFRIICGIPSVILEGTVADWELLGNKIQALHTSDLELDWWTQHLLPLCGQFVRAARGDVDLNHWQDLCKVMARYGRDDMNGWLLKFIPYVRRDPNEHPVHRNPVLEFKPEAKEPADPNARRFTITGCTSNMLPTGLSSVPVTCHNDETGQDLQLRFLAGFTGIEQDPEDLSLRPLVGWAIAEPSGMEVLIQRLRREFGCTAPKPMAPAHMVELFHGHLPGDMWKFYTEISGVALKFRHPNRWQEADCHLAALDAIAPTWDRESVMGELKYLASQYEITPVLLAERREFYLTYSSLVRIASTWPKQQGEAYYVFGSIDKAGPGIYRWTGQHSPKAFTRVADSFTEWLAGLLEAAVPKAED